MRLNKNTNIKKYTVLLFSLLILPSIFAITNIVPLNFIDEDEKFDEFVEEEGLFEEPIIEFDDIIPSFDPQQYLLDITEEEIVESTYDREAIDWRPIEDTLKNFQIKNEAESGTIATVSYNTLTGKETQSTPQFTPTPETATASGIRVVDPYKGLLPSETQARPESVIGGDDRKIYNNVGFPGRTIVKLYISAPWGGNWVGSGAIIDNFHVLTAGHCAYIYDDDTGNEGWASSIEVVPGMDLADSVPDPYGNAWVVGMRSYNGWTENENNEHDWALLTLDRNVGAFTGWMGRITAPSSSSIYDNTMNVAGYPTDLDSGDRLYHDSDSGDGAWSNIHFYWADTFGGMSGGPVWRYSDGTRRIMTIHAYGQDGEDSNYGTRLNNNKFDRILTWLSQDSAPTDKPDLIDRGAAYSSRSFVAPLTAGVTTLTVSNGIRNKGTAWSGNFHVHYYASTNDFISTGDYLLGSDSVSSIAPFSTGSASWSGKVPSSIPEGDYHIGWIIDQGNVVDEFDETNNRAWEVIEHIDGLPPPISYIEVRVRNYVASRSGVPIRLSPIAGAFVKVIKYGFWVADTGYTDSTGFYNVTGLSIGEYEIEVSKPGYYDDSKIDLIHQSVVLSQGYDDDYLYFYLNEMPYDGGYIEVTVKDSTTSNLLSSAKVELLNFTTGQVLSSGYTNNVGEYTITGLWIGWYEVRVSRYGYKTETKFNYINWNGDDDYLTFSIDEMPFDSGYIEVRVYNDTGDPVENAVVNTYNYTSGLLIDTGHTDVNGTYNVTGLMIGWYSVNVSMLTFYGQEKNDYISWFGDDDYMTFYLTTLPPDSGFIEVYVIDNITLTPITGAYIQTINQSSGDVIDWGYTDMSGYYQIENLTIGWYEVNVTKGGYKAPESQLAEINYVGDGDVLKFYVLPYPPDSGYIEVEVIDDATTLALVNATVDCYYLNGTLFDSGLTDINGFYNITGLYIGWYKVEVSIKEYKGESVYDLINWNGDDDYLAFSLETSPLSYIIVQIFDKYLNLPIANAYISCFNATSGLLFHSGYADSSGYYNVSGLLPGWWTVNASHVAFFAQSKTEHIEFLGDISSLNFSLELKVEPITGPVAVFRDVLGLNVNATEPVLVEYNISYTIYNSSDIGLVDLSPFQKVIIASDQPQSFYWAMGNNTSFFNNYAASGGPVWRYVSGYRYIMTVHAYGRGGVLSNYGTRLNADKYNRLFNWLGEDSAPTDKADLVDRGSSYDTVTGGTWQAGVTSVTITNGIRNVGTATSGNYYVHYYASTNNYISIYDYYIGTSTLESTGAFGTDSATFTGTLPADIPAGVYYIGWIIDKDNNVAEFDEGNNVAVYASQRTILGAPPPSGYIEVTVRDSTTYNLIPLAYVVVKDDTDTVIDTGYTDGSGFYNVTELDIGWFTVDISKVGYHSQYKRNYINWDGDDDYLTFYMVQMPPDSGYIEVNVKDSDTYNPISSAYVQVTNMSSGLVIKAGYTNSAGFYNVTGLYIGWYEVKVTRTSYKDQIKQDYINWNGDDDYLYFYLKKMPANSGYIEVRTLNETGGPLAGVLVRAWNNSGATLVSSGYSDADGIYNITGLVIGWYEVNVTYLGWQEQSKSDYINWNGDDDYLSFWMVPNPPASSYIEVRVYDSGSYLAISSALVTVTNQSSGLVIQTGYTDPTGFYKVVNLTIGWYTIQVTRVGYHAQSKTDYIHWAGDDDYLSFYLIAMPPDSGYIEVLVRDADTYNPIQSAYVRCLYLNGTLFKTGYTDNSGFFNITGLIIGWYTVEVSKAGYGGQSKQDYINWNGDDDYLYFYLRTMPPDSGYIEVRVYDATSYIPIENAYVECFNTTTGTLVFSGFTDSFGLITITGLYIGWLTVNVTHSLYERQSQNNYINWNGDDDYLYFYLTKLESYISGQVAIFRDILPWNLNMTEPILKAHAISYTVYDSQDFGSVSLAPFQKVIIPSDQTQTFYDRLATNRVWFETYVSNGGILELHASDRAWGGGNWDSYTMPGGLTKTFVYLENVSIVNPTHPLLNIPYGVEDDELDGWFYSAHGYFDTYPANANEVLNYPVTSNPVLLEFAFGSGFIIATMQTLEWNQNLNYTRLLENIILYNPLAISDSIIIFNPIGATSWQNGTIHTLTWATTGNIANVKIELYRAGIYVMDIAANTPSDDEYIWNVPGSLSKSTQYQIKMTNIADSTTYAFSTPFEIWTDTITLTSPTSIDSWETGTSHLITWTHTGTNFANVRILLYENDTYLMEIIASTPNDGEFNWTIPFGLLNSSLYQIVIMDAAYPNTVDTSDYFEIFEVDVLTITAPDISSIWETTRSYYILWNSIGSVANVSIDLFENGVFLSIISNNTPNDGVYIWQIPFSLSDSLLYQIKISDEIHSFTYDFSENFEIFKPTITITSPDISDVWDIGSIQLITWNSTGTITDVKIELYENSIFVMEITASTPNDGSYSWTVPVSLNESLLYQIRVSDAVEALIEDYSDNFEIEDTRSLTVVLPDSITSWAISETKDIDWNSTGIIANVKIDLYENGAFVMELAASTPNDGSFSWTVPIGLNDSILYQIRISDALDTTMEDYSDNFEIEDTRSITVVTPDSTTGWTMGDTRDITWTSTGTIANVKIELLVNSISIMDIAVSTPNDGTYEWAIPNTLANYTDYVIRVSDFSDPTVFDDSETFTITGEDAIPGYDLLILMGLIFGVAFVLIRKKRVKLAYSRDNYYKNS